MQVLATIRSLLAVSIDVSLVRGLADTTLPLLLLEDAFDTLPVSACDGLWDIFAERQGELAPEVSSSQKHRMPLLRIASSLVRRLSRTQHTVLLGRVLFALAYMFPLTDRSGVNLLGHFDSDNITEYEGRAEDDALRVILEKFSPAPTAAIVTATATNAGPSGMQRGQSRRAVEVAPSPIAAAAPSPILAIVNVDDVTASLVPLLPLTAAAASLLREAAAAVSTGVASSSSAFYRVFWNLQSYFVAPGRAVASTEAWLFFSASAGLVLRALEREEVAAAAAAVAASAAAAGVKNAVTTASSSATSTTAARQVAVAAASKEEGEETDDEAGPRGDEAVNDARRSSAGGVAAGARTVDVTTAPAASSCVDDVPQSPGRAGGGAGSDMPTSSSSAASSAQVVAPTVNIAAPLGVKYLTNPRLLPLQLRDAALRRHIAVQLLIMLHYLGAQRVDAEAYAAHAIAVAEATAASSSPAGVVTASTTGGKKQHPAETTTKQTPPNSGVAKAAPIPAAAATGPPAVGAAPRKPRETFAVPLLLAPLAGAAPKAPPHGVNVGSDISALTARTFRLISSSRPDGVAFAAAARIVLERETAWRAWKSAGAQPFERGAEVPKPTPAGGASATSGASAAVETVGVKRRAPTGDVDGATADSMSVGVNPPMRRLAKRARGEAQHPRRVETWALEGLSSNLLERAADTTRRAAVDLDAFLAQQREAMDPEAGIEPEYWPSTSAVYVWRAYRLISATKLRAMEGVSCEGTTFADTVRRVYASDLDTAAAAAAAVAAAPLPVQDPLAGDSNAAGDTQNVMFNGTENTLSGGSHATAVVIGDGLAPEPAAASTVALAGPGDVDVNKDVEPRATHEDAVMQPS